MHKLAQTYPQNLCSGLHKFIRKTCTNCTLTLSPYKGGVMSESDQTFRASAAMNGKGALASCAAAMSAAIRSTRITIGAAGRGGLFSSCVSVAAIVANSRVKIACFLQKLAPSSTARSDHAYKRFSISDISCAVKDKVYLSAISSSPRAAFDMMARLFTSKFGASKGSSLPIPNRGRSDERSRQGFLPVGDIQSHERDR